MDRDLDVFTNYRNINNKIKKRFLKKPNYADASEQFGTLTRFLKQQESPQYAGFCCLAKARCENILASPVAEAESLLEAARLYFEAEKKNVDVKCPSLDEHLAEAVLCYNYAFKAYVKEGNQSQAAMVSYELANKLLSISKLDQAYCHYIRAANVQKEYSTLDYISTLQQAADCKLLQCNYTIALQHLSEVANTIESLTSVDKNCLTYSMKQLLQQVEVRRVLGLLLLKSSPMSLNEEHVKVLEKYTWENRDNNPVLPDQLFLLIQSVVMATQAGDSEILSEMEQQLYEHLDATQLELLHRIVQDVAQ